jgi:aryl-alcohol dehydrogenase-like predicted oxidoreductase
MMQTRPFGKTGESFPILSFGAQRVVDEEGCSQDQALEILNTALNRGIRYFDTAWRYSQGQSEERVGMVAKHRRPEMWIATKTWDVTRDGARRQLEESLVRLQTDYVDEWRLHNVWGFDRLDQMTGKGGALEAAIQARDEGLVRFISISGHTDPQVQIEALRRFPFDTALVAVSVLDHFLYSFAEEFLPVAACLGVGVVGMKIFGSKKLAHVADRALRYALALPLTTVIAGCRREL